MTLTKEQYRKRVSSGICIGCTNRAEPSRIMCTDCSIKRNKQRNRRRQRNPNWKIGRQPRATAKPSLRDLEKIAGFLEGEGTFYKSPSRAQCVRAYQVERAPLEFTQRCLGGTIIFVSREDGQNGWVWNASGVRARGIMMTLYPLMLSDKRKAQIRKALSIHAPNNQIQRGN